MFLKAFFVLGIVPVTMALGGCSNSTTEPADSGKAKGTIYMNGETRSRIYSFDVKTGTGTNLLAGSDPYVTPEGTIICSANNGDLVEYSKDGTTKRVIVKSEIYAPYEETYNDAFKSPQLSPDGKYIAYEGQFGYRFDMYVVERQTGKLVTQFFEDFTVAGFERPSWTPDGRIVFSGKPNANPGLYITSKDFKTYERIDQDLSDPRQPKVSPDGKLIAFILNDHLYTLNIDGTNLKQITTSDWKESWPTWSPDGQWIAIYGNTSILLVPLNNKDGYVDLDNINDNFMTFTAFKDGQFQWVY